MTADLSNNAYAQAILANMKTPEQYKVPVRVYFHHHNHARFHFDMGGSRVRTVEFAAHKYITDDKREQDQLDLVADHPGSFIYTLPNSDVAAALEQELYQQKQKDIMSTAAAQAAVTGTQHDPNTPIIPVNVASSTPHGIAVVGMQNSFSGSQATQEVKRMVVPQTSAPTAQTVAQQVAAEALANLHSLTK